MLTMDGAHVGDAEASAAGSGSDDDGGWAAVAASDELAASGAAAAAAAAGQMVSVWEHQAATAAAEPRWVRTAAALTSRYAAGVGARDSGEEIRGEGRPERRGEEMGQRVKGDHAGGRSEALSPHCPALPPHCLCTAPALSRHYPRTAPALPSTNRRPACCSVRPPPQPAGCSL